jgi:putative DNA primase/helicase
MSWQDEQFQKLREADSEESVAIDTVNVAVLDPSETSGPKALPDILPPVELFDLDLLPDSLRAWIEDVAERLQCPADYSAVAAMVLLGGIVGRKIGIRPKRHDDWLVIPNLWGAVIGRPGLMKTPALQEPLRIVRQFETDAKSKFDSAQQGHKSKAIVAELEGKQLKKTLDKAIRDGKDLSGILRKLENLEEPEPIRRRHIVNDTTVEMLGELLKQNPNGLTLFRDELTGFLKSLDKEGREGARAFYLESWNGDGRFTYDRIGRGTIDIPAAIVSIIGAIQPGPLGEYLRHQAAGGAGDDGLIQRFQLIVWPDCPTTWRNVDRIPDGVAKQRAYEVYERLDRMNAVELAAQRDENDSISFLRFDSDAQDQFDEWREKLEIGLRSGNEHPTIESHLAKYRSLIPSLALLIHLADDPGGGAVTAIALDKAIRWGQYLESHARRIYGSVAQRSVVAASNLAGKIRDGSLPPEFTLREIYRHGWTGLSERSEAFAAVEVLLDHDWISESRVESGTKPKTVFRVNTQVYENQA